MRQKIKAAKFQILLTVELEFLISKNWPPIPLKQILKGNRQG